MEAGKELSDQWLLIELKLDKLRARGGGLFALGLCLLFIGVLFLKSIATLWLLTIITIGISVLVPGQFILRRVTRLHDIIRAHQNHDNATNSKTHHLAHSSVNRHEPP